MHSRALAFDLHYWYEPGQTFKPSTPTSEQFKLLKALDYHINFVVSK